MIDHAGSLDGFSESIIINTDRYKVSSLSGDGHPAQSSITTYRGSITNKSLIGVDVVPITDFLDWDYFEQVHVYDWLS